jgi:DNA-binding GntR family transcriptional regulator
VADETLRSLDRTTLRERALVSLRSAIVSGQYQPGDHLGEVEIAERLSISRGTVREALRHLQQEGLLTPGMRGMLRVRTLSTREVRELFRVREALEGLAISEIIASDNRLEAVAELGTALKELAEEDEFAKRVQADLHFHARLCELSGNSMLVQTWRHLEGPILIVVMSAENEQRRAAMSAAHHRPIVEAIERGDSEAATAVLHQHMTEAVEQLTSHE